MGIKSLNICGDFAGDDVFGDYSTRSDNAVRVLATNTKYELNNTANFSIADFENGIYVLKVETENGIFVSKIIKN